MATVARRGPHSAVDDPSSAPRKANSSGMAVSSTTTTVTSYSSRPPVISPRASWSIGCVRGTTAASRTTTATVPKAAAPYRTPAGAAARSSPRSAAEAPADQATSASTAVSTGIDTPGGPASPSPRTTLKTTRTATACRKHRRGLVTQKMTTAAADVARHPGRMGHHLLPRERVRPEPDPWSCTAPSPLTARRTPQIGWLPSPASATRIALSHRGSGPRLREASRTEREVRPLLVQEPVPIEYLPSNPATGRCRGRSPPR